MAQHIPVQIADKVFIGLLMFSGYELLKDFITDHLFKACLVIVHKGGCSRNTENVLVLRAGPNKRKVGRSRKLVEVRFTTETLLARISAQHTIGYGMPATFNEIIVVTRTNVTAHRLVDKLIVERLDVAHSPVAGNMVKVLPEVSKYARHHAEKHTKAKRKRR